jgi:hypothetical protein
MTSTFKFKVGHHVCFNPGAFGAARPEVYEVTRQMPLQGIEFEYQIGSAGAAGDRVVRESQLRVAPPPSRSPKPALE